MVWRLNQLPDVEEITLLIKQKVITNDEAREMLFRSETEEDRDKKGLESEIKFLRELVEKLSKSKSEITTIIKEIEVPYQRNPWYSPYITWCDGSSGNYSINASNTTNTSFSDIKTF